MKSVGFAAQVSTLSAILAVTAHASAGNVYGSYTGSQRGITVRDTALTQTKYIPTTFAPTAIAAASGSFYVVSANNILHYGADGTQKKAFAFPDAKINYTGVTFAGANIFVSYTGSQQGVSMRDASSLVQSAYFATPFSPKAVAVGPNGTLYLAAQNHLYKYTTGGKLLLDMNFPDTGVNYTGVVVKDGVVYASYTGSQRGITVRSLDLVQTRYMPVPFSPTGISAGNANDLFLSTVDHLYRYSTDGKQLKDMTFPQIEYTGISAEADVTVAPPPPPPPPAAAKPDYCYGAYAGSQLGVTIRTEDLDQNAYRPVDFAPTAITAHLNGTYYLVSGNRINHYKSDGSLLRDFVFPDAGIKYTGITFGNGEVLVAYSGSQQGFSRRNAVSLTQSAYLPLPFSPKAIAAGPGNTVFLASANHLYRYTRQGKQQIDMTFPDTGINYTGLVVSGKTVYASYDGSQTGVTVRSLDLVQDRYLPTPFAPTGISMGANGDLYLSAKDHLYRYTTAGVQVKDMYFPQIDYVGVSCLARPR